MNNIFVHYIKRRKKNRRSWENLYVCGLKGIFDKVDRNKLWEIMRRKKISKKLVRRIEKIYEKNERNSENKIRKHKKFLKKSVRQGCVMSPVSCLIYILRI